MAALVMVFWVWLAFNIPPITPSGRGLSHHDQKRKLASTIPGFISIDCGATLQNYDDSNMFYQTDTGFISAGVNSQISSEFINSSLNMELRTLRYFPEGEQNCYTLKPEQGRSNNYLIRAVFMYGNYDGKNETPVFQLYLGVNSWTTVKDSYVVHEIIYAPLTDAIQVCLVNKDNGTPYISALEVRQLDNSLYQSGNGALALTSRINLGGSNKIIRYADDIYDRKWNHDQKNEWIPVTLAPNLTIEISNNGYKVPDKVLGTAVKCVSGPIYVSWQSNFALTGKTTYNFSISSVDSGLPPILNAYEIYQHKDFYRLPTIEKDVDAIINIINTYGIIGEWQGDPCFPSSWNILNCSSISPPNIISLDLSHNQLTGPIPEFLAQLPYLRDLNLMGNQLEDAVPKALMEKHNSGGLTLNLDGNPDLCLVGSCKGKNRKVVAIVAPTVSVVVFIILCALAIYHIREKKRKGTRREWSLKAKNWRFTYSEIVNITNNFKSVIGEGGFGRVYHGSLTHGIEVAIKVLSSSSRQGSDEFQNEVDLLFGIHHKNLVSLFGYCNEGGNMALVYDYMACGNLQQHLLADRSTNVLTWKERLEIAVDAARGLDYLHNCCKPPIVHRDLKTSNILLSEDLQARIGDFGLCRVFTTDNETHISTDAKGTRGYVDPEDYHTGKLNRKSDVYSFGIGIGDIVDPRLESYNINSAWRAIEVAMACIPSIAIQRPDISYVYDELKACLKMEMASEKPQIMEGYQTWSSSSIHTTPLDPKVEMHHTC
ncbi:PREDICTED: probable [Prunus dulcis]|uniref:non-specific serine/threonine protein kinase n=1 Tax=Prunus dulcis TaxID=3755 RepID=A0A5E4ED08_PRUDU|nr:PREDICTED: probable [Prunus dulcis]